MKIQREHGISALLENVVSHFGSIPRCTTLGCPLHTSPANTPTHTPKASPPGTPRSHTKRHNDGFITPPASKAARKVLFKTPGMAPVSLENRFNFPSNEIDAEFPALPATQPTLATNTNNNAAVQHSQAGVTTSSSQNTHQMPTIPITNQGSHTGVTPSSPQPANTPKPKLPPPKPKSAQNHRLILRTHQHNLTILPRNKNQNHRRIH
ncbi:hypothetical protein TNCT_299701 [Trichonephila clavata]|uniref:Uncharacterized protein n=1 Tax=Trichonephila clavata TaxID=2740835 RepID=A0A8X6HY08_TRICU|nr:hypothetical protein TNCT_299701 [Trichonephila clavata]